MMVDKGQKKTRNAIPGKSQSGRDPLTLVGPVSDLQVENGTKPDIELALKLERTIPCAVGMEGRWSRDTSSSAAFFG